MICSYLIKHHAHGCRPGRRYLVTSKPSIECLTGVGCWILDFRCANKQTRTKQKKTQLKIGMSQRARVTPTQLLKTKAHELQLKERHKGFLSFNS